MLSFQNDYQEGAHEKILKRLMETNLEPQSGYGSRFLYRECKGKDPKGLRMARRRMCGS